MISEMMSLLSPVKVDLPEGLRMATVEDVAGMVALGEIFFEETILPEMTAYDPESMAVTLTALVNGLNSVVIVLEHEGEMVGGIGGYTLPAYFNMNSIFGQQVFWFVHPCYRSAKALKLIEAFEHWCKESGANMVWSGAKMNGKYESMSKVLKRRGYQSLESVFIKGV